MSPDVSFSLCLTGSIPPAAGAVGVLGRLDHSARRHSRNGRGGSPPLYRRSREGLAPLPYPVPRPSGCCSHRTHIKWVYMTATIGMSLHLVQIRNNSTVCVHRCWHFSCGGVFTTSVLFQFIYFAGLMNFQLNFDDIGRFPTDCLTKSRVSTIFDTHTIVFVWFC